MALASLADYTTRYGTPDDPDKVSQLIEDASSLVCQEADLTISFVSGDVVTVETGGDSIAFLPEHPVTAVTSVLVDGVAVTDFDWWPYGMLRHNAGVFPNKPRSLEVTYDHGYDPVPAWLVNLVCTMTERARTHGAEGPVSQESFVDAYSVSYRSGEGTDEVVGLHVDECTLVRNGLNPAKSIA